MTNYIIPIICVGIKFYNYYAYHVIVYYRGIGSMGASALIKYFLPDSSEPNDYENIAKDTICLTIT